jgi:hypothetical protein
MKLKLSLKNRNGLALPMTILVMTALTAAVAAGFAGVATEYTTNSAERSQNRAYHIAETGLEQFMVLRGSKDSTGAQWCQNCVNDPTVVDSEWTRVTLPGGYADVVAFRVRPMVPAVVDSSDAIYFIRSRGVDTSIKLSGAGGSFTAERTVGVYATWNTATMNVQAAWLSLSGLLKNGTGIISGFDQCGQRPPVAGVMVDSGDLVIKGGSFAPAGNPPVDTSNNFTNLKNKMNLDWAGILAGSITPDITIPGGTFPPASVFDADTTYWPVIRIHTNNYSLPNHGHGIIIADSNFVVSGSNMWAGIILVGGTLTSNGINTVSGATITGLNYMIGGTPSMSTVDDAIANGNKNYVYNSCSVAMASQHMRKYSAMPNSWVDNVASW